jgi:hypothetical protein
MNEELLSLAKRISGELGELDRVIERIYEGWRRAQQFSDDFYLDSVALNLQSFYGGMEGIFELVATIIDESLPQGAEWHKALLDQMSIELPNLRPALISEETRKFLDEYRSFRHVVRNIYAFKLSSAKIQHLVESLSTTFAQVKLEISAFIRFLGKQAEEVE